MKSKKKDSIFVQELKRDFQTFKSLTPKKRAQFIFDYYKWYIIAFIAAVMILISLGRIIIEGQKPYRLRVCVVLNNTEKDCSLWFNKFEEMLLSDGKDDGELDLNQDQPFDYDNSYYYVQEMEVMTTISSYRMDVAICGPDMYDYILALNACYPLDEALDSSLFESLKDDGTALYATANLQIQEDGSVDESEGIDGYFAIDITDTEFGKQYNVDLEPDENGEVPRLYAMIIRNTDHLEDSVKLLETLVNE